MQSPEKSALQLKMLTPFFTPEVFAQRAVVEDLTTFCARRKPFSAYHPSRLLFLR